MTASACAFFGIRASTAGGLLTIVAGGSNAGVLECNFYGASDTCCIPGLFHACNPFELSFCFRSHLWNRRRVPSKNAVHRSGALNI